MKKKLDHEAEQLKRRELMAELTKKLLAKLEITLGHPSPKDLKFKEEVKAYMKEKTKDMYIPSYEDILEGREDAEHFQKLYRLFQDGVIDEDLLVWGNRVSFEEHDGETQVITEESDPEDEIDGDEEE